MSDVVLVGGGLANALIALRLKRVDPVRRVRLVEREAAVGHGKTWSFHEADLSEEQRRWIGPFVACSWSGYRVLFPHRERRLDHGYFSVASASLHAAVGEALGDDLLLGCEASSIEPSRVELQDGRSLSATCVIDGRGLAPPLPFEAGYQKFLGISATFAAPIDVAEPLLMDASVPQRDGFRFVYTLPWSERTALIEDTYYSASPLLDRERAREACHAYAAGRGWEIATVDREESGVLPIPLAGGFDEIETGWPKGVPAVGTRAGLFHPTTGYSLPDALRTADALAGLNPLTTSRALALMRELGRRTWGERSYFRMLNRLMFEAAEPADRYRVLEHFYAMPDGLIRRFYAACLSRLDRVRLLSGRPPVPVSSAARVLARRSWLAR